MQGATLAFGQGAQGRGSRGAEGFDSAGSSGSGSASPTGPAALIAIAACWLRSLRQPVAREPKRSFGLARLTTSRETNPQSTTPPTANHIWLLLKAVEHRPPPSLSSARFSTVT